MPDYVCKYFHHGTILCFCDVILVYTFSLVSGMYILYLTSSSRAQVWSQANSLKIHQRFCNCSGVQFKVHGDLRHVG